MKRIAKKARHQRNMPSGSEMVATKLKASGGLQFATR